MTAKTPAKPSTKTLLGLTLGSIGVVYGDIGTSPLYAFRESIKAASGGSGIIDQQIVLGVLSLILWALLIVVLAKYILLVLRADNQGEGGILSLMALTQNALDHATAKKSAIILTLGMTGAALFYGDSMITPAISVLSAVEGMKLVTDEVTPYLIPIAICIIVLLFVIQRRGTAKVARFFGPIMLLWFMALALGGLNHIFDNPIVWQAINPYHALYFLTHHGFISFITLGSVFLTVTGTESLYADLGHFGKKPIRLAWIFIVMPSLVLNYIGQAALILSHQETAANPFFLLYPEWALLPMVILATLATVMASQAVITGTFSLTHQAVQLGLLPRLQVTYTSARLVGQIYMPKVNWLLLCGVLVLIGLFRSSSNLAAAYGVAVSGTMLITGIFIFFVMRHVWRWSRPVVLAVIVPLLLLDLTFLVANLVKILDGGYLPLIISSILILMMRTWVRGSYELHQETRKQATMDMLMKTLRQHPPALVEGTAIYLSSNTDYAPSALLQNLKHNKVLHQRNILLTLRFEKTPYVSEAKRIHIEHLEDGFIQVFMHFGYMDAPNVTRALGLLSNEGMTIDMSTTTFFISRRNIVTSRNFGMPVWQDRIYIAMADSANDAAAYFRLPTSRVVEMGVQVTV